MSAPKEQPKDVEKIGTFDPCEHAFDYIDGDDDDYTPGEDQGSQYPNWEDDYKP